MFLVINRSEDLLAVLDTSDFVVERHPFSTIKGYLASGIKIQGISQGKDKVWDIKIQKGVIPADLDAKIKAFARRWEDSALGDYFEVVEYMNLHFLSLQMWGENLKTKFSKIEFKELCAIYKER